MYSMNCGPQERGTAVTTLPAQKDLIEANEAPPSSMRATSQLAVFRGTLGLQFRHCSTVTLNSPEFGSPAHVARCRDKWLFHHGRGHLRGKVEPER